MDGTGKLCKKLYGKENVDKMLGGSDAPMLHDAVAKIEELEQRLETAPAVDTIVSRVEWISVENKLPDEGERVWVYNPTARFETKKQCSKIYRKGEFDWERYITHWRPLPKPPAD